MATVTHAVSTTSSSNTNSYPSAAFTPALQDLLVGFVVASGTVASGGMTSSRPGFTFSKVTSAVKNSSADTIYAFVADQLVSEAVSQTATFDCTGDNATGAIIFIARVSGITKFGTPAASVRQYAVQNNQAGSTTAAPAFSASALTTNPTLGVVGNGASPAGLTQPSGWSEQGDTGYGTPTTGGEYVSRDSGFTGTTITWGSGSASAYGDIILEIDASTPAAPPYLVLPPFVPAPGLDLRGD